MKISHYRQMQTVLKMKIILMVKVKNRRMILQGKINKLVLVLINNLIKERANRHH